jgi:hypothetical protein
VTHVDDTYAIDLLDVVGIPERTVVFQTIEDEEFGTDSTRWLESNETAGSGRERAIQQNIVLTVTGAAELETTFDSTVTIYIVDFKTAPDKVFDVGVPNKVSNILIDDATGATTIGSDVRTDGILVLDERRGRIEPVGGDYSDSALQFSVGASSGPIPKPCDTRDRYPCGWNGRKLLL